MFCFVFSRAGAIVNEGADTMAGVDTVVRGATGSGADDETTDRLDEADGADGADVADDEVEAEGGARVEVASDAVVE